MVLPPGFRHVDDPCLDVPCGRMWKFAGPQVLYSLRGGPDVRDLSGIQSIKTVMVGDDEPTVVRLARNELGIQLAIRFQGATFEVTNVRTEQDINEIVRMVGTYSSPTWQEGKKLLREEQLKKEAQSKK